MCLFVCVSVCHDFRTVKWNCLATKSPLKKVVRFKAESFAPNRVKNIENSARNQENKFGNLKEI